MIKSRDDMRRYIQEDQKRQPIKYPLMAALTYSESYLVRKYLTILRHYEYYLNKTRCLNEKNIPSSIWGGVFYLMLVIYFLRWRRQCIKTGIQVYPNTCGPGLAITHHSYVHIDNLTTIGKNCSVLPMCLFGKNKAGRIIVGDNVTFGCGVTVLAPVTIGNNVYIGAGAVVNKDIPDNSIVAGVPAKIIGKKQN